MKSRNLFLTLLLVPIFLFVLTTIAYSVRMLNTFPEMIDEPVEPRIVGFDEVTGAKNGQQVTVTAWIDEKYLCMDVNETQREICTTAFIGPRPGGAAGGMIIQLRVCSPERRTNCIVYEPKPGGDIDLRDVFVYDNDGKAIDFDGLRLLRPPDEWIMEGQRLKLTSRVTIVDGQGKFIEPIEKIEAE